MTRQERIGVMFIILGILLMLHHYIFWKKIYDIQDIAHHEFFEAILFTAGITLLLTYYVNKKGRRNK